MRVNTLIIAFLVAASLPTGANSQAFDLVVYGGTAAGVMTAIAGGRQGLKTILLEPGAHVGGRATGGLSRTDVGRREVIGGLALEFYYRVGERYQMRRFNNPVAWFYEPKLGEVVLREMLQQAGVTVQFRRRLRESSGVVKRGSTVELRVEDGSSYSGKIFADCSYEGDLMAQAKISYTWGRESTAKYGESLAGVRERTPLHQFMVDIPARDEQGKLLPEISPEPRGVPRAADRRVQAYNFRVIAANDAANRIPWPRPANYDAHRYELLARMLPMLTAQKGRAPVLNELTLIALIPNGKADFNNQGAFSTDYIGKSYDYPEGSYKRRAHLASRPSHAPKAVGSCSARMGYLQSHVWQIPLAIFAMLGAARGEVVYGIRYRRTLCWSQRHGVRGCLSSGLHSPQKRHGVRGRPAGV